MPVSQLIKNHYIKGYKRYRRFARTASELYKILFKRRYEWSSCKLTKEQKLSAKAYMKKHYGKTVPLWWHRLYTNCTGVFDEAYFPEILFAAKLEEILNPYSIAFPLGDKAFNPQKLFSDLDDKYNVRNPEMYLLNCNGTKWDSKGNVVDISGAVSALENIGEVIIKPTLDTTGAKGVRLLNIKDATDTLTGESVADILKRYKSDYIIQERVRNHPNIDKLYSDSINTLRVITYICQDKIYTAPLALRLGVGGNYVDNGGIYIGLDEDGNLRDEGFKKRGYTPYREHPDSKVKFSGYRVEYVRERVEAAIRLHSKIPQLKMLSWDLAYDRNGKIVIIEVNTHSHSLGFPQRVNGKSFFGENTEYMYKLLKQTK